MPPGRYILEKFCKKTSYYFVNFCLEKIIKNWEGVFIRGGGGVKSRVYGVYKNPTDNDFLQQRWCEMIV